MGIIALSPTEAAVRLCRVQRHARVAAAHAGAKAARENDALANGSRTDSSLDTQSKAEGEFPFAENSMNYNHGQP